MLIAQLSDTHIAVPEDEFSELYHPAEKLRNAVRHVNGSVNRPDIVFLTGDLVNSAKAEEYVILKEIVAEFEMPVYLLPGNHDDCTLLRKAFPDHDYLPSSGTLNYVVDGWPLKLIALDTNIHGKPQGHLGEVQLAWLEEEISKEAARPVVILLHHPPFKTGLTSMDAMGLGDNNELGTAFEPPEYLLHYWTEEGGLVTHSDYVKEYDVAWTLKDGVKKSD